MKSLDQESDPVNWLLRNTKDWLKARAAHWGDPVGVFLGHPAL